MEWCLVVTTPEEAILCALAREKSSDAEETNDGFRHGADSILRLIPTRFVLPTDSVPLMSVCGSKDGRIFMGGYDGCLYEMSYEGNSPKFGSYASSNVSGSEFIEAAIDDYFDGRGVFDLSKTFSNGRNGGNWSGNALLNGGKRVFSALTFGSLDDSGEQRARKCRKINHSSAAPALVSSMVPGALVRVASGIFGSSTEAAARKGGSIVSLLMDEERFCLYTLGANGVICAYDLNPLPDKKNSQSGANGSSLQSNIPSASTSPPRLACVFDAVASAKLYIESVSRGRMYPPATSHAVELGTITFPGGIGSAQAGLGSMEGAREILKRHDQESRLASSASKSSSRPLKNQTTNSAGILHPVSIHLVPGAESKSLSLVAITGGGLRYYLSSLSSSSINSAQASQGGFGYSVRGGNSELARTRPSKKMTFCHIRAPPPYTSGDGNDGFRFELAPSAISQYGMAGSGMPPGILNTQIMGNGKGLSAGGDVVKSFYGKGVFILALDLDKKNPRDSRSDKNGSSDGFFSPSSESSNSSRQILGDSIIVALPDFAARLLESSSASARALTTNTASSPSSLVSAGGISESVLLPMAGIGGSRSPVLPGGRTYDIVANTRKQCSVVNLLMNSETPSDTELQIGLMSSFTPPMSRSRKTLYSNGASSLVVSNNTGRGVISSALSAFSNYLRSGQGSGEHVGTILTDPNGFGPSVTYRVSFRHGCDQNGFSSSAAETRSTTRTITRQQTNNSLAKSARLPSWLLKPSAAPLNSQATQHLLPPGSGSVVILNAGGLHFFHNSSLLNNLATVLLRATNMAKDNLVRNFFASYGYVEGCAMCFALATSNSSSDLLKKKAEQAALCHAHVPSMKLVGPSSGDGCDPISAYKFQPSSLYDGLVKFFSRLLRPFWYKPAVVVTEGRPLRTKSVYSNYYASLPAKVELLLNDSTLDDIRKPLVSLQKLMRKVFVPAVNSIPGLSNKSSPDAMDIDEDGSSGGLITRAMQNHSRALQRINSGAQAQYSTEKERETIAFRTEERNMHSLYRLLSRCVQMLDLMSCLKRAHSTPALPEVQWGLLHGLTFYQLVTRQEGQQRVEALLNALVSQADNNLVSGFSTDGDSLADTLSRKCYLFFSSASRLTYSGFRNANDALSLPPSSPRRAELANQAAMFLRSAARHWYNPNIVAGRSIPKNSTDTWEDIATFAIDAGSPLALAANVLMKLGNAKGLADVCLICASNFGGAKVQRDERKELGESRVEDMLNWERGLYHRPPAELSGDQKTPGSQAIVNGIDVTPQDGLRTCHSIVFFYISKLLGNGGALNNRLADELVASCASSSDVKFLRLLYEHLLKTNQVDTLLRIDSSSLENWLLNEKKDDHILWRYYSFHGRNVLAGDIMLQRAESDQKVHLDQRIECLTRAAGSFDSALKASHSRTNVNMSFNRTFDQGMHSGLQEQQVSVNELNNRIKNIGEKIDVATIQRRVLTTVEQSENTDLSSAKKTSLTYTLVNVSDIYNEYACALNLFDVCLLIIQTCQHNDGEKIRTLWKNIICEEVLPCQTSSESAAHFLRALKQGTLFEEAAIVHGEDAGGNLQKFDCGEWIPRLRSRVAGIGKELLGKGADYTFPLDFIVEELEGKKTCND